MKKLVSVFAAGLMLVTTNSFAAGNSAVELSDVDFERSPEAYQRGFKVINEVCRLCHSFKYIKYVNLRDIGLTEEQVNELRGEQLLSDSLRAYMDPGAAKGAFGMVPPDLSVMAKARKGGPNYIYTLLTSYHNTDTGNVDNKLFPGIKMPDVLSWSVYEDDASREEIKAKLSDAVSFLSWAADPHEDTRKAMGVWVIGYLIILTFMLWLVKRRIWARLPPPSSGH